MTGAKPKLSVGATRDHGFSAHLIKAEPDYKRSKVFSWSLLILCTASFYLGPFLLFLPLPLYFIHPGAASTLFCTNLFLAFYPVSPWPKFREYCQSFYPIFNVRHNFRQQFDEILARENRLSIIAMHPHAIIPVHGFIWGAICDQLFPHMYGYGGATDISLRLPVLRHLLGYLGVGSASKAKALSEMQAKGQHFFVLPGGVAEIFLSRRRTHPDDPAAHPNTQTIKARSYGLMKLALQTGAAIYPAYVFGASDLLDQLTPVDSKESSVSSIGVTMQSVSRKIRGGLTLYYGRYYLPIPYTPHLSIVLGNPIYPVENEPSTKNVTGEKNTCPRVENPSQEQVEELMDRYVNAVQCLFTQYKAQAGFPNDTLEIIGHGD